MNRITKFEISGFRRLGNLSLDIHPLTVMIGANGVGKTTVLDAFSLLAESAKGKLNDELNRLEGFTSILTSGRATDLSIAADISLDNSDPFHYSLTLSEKRGGHYISAETLSHPTSSNHTPDSSLLIDSHDREIKYFSSDDNQWIIPNWNHNYWESSLSQVPKNYVKTDEIRKIIGASAYYHTLPVDGRAPVRLPQKMQPVDSPGRDGEYLIPFLYYLREMEPDRFEAIEDAMRAAFPGFEGLKFPPAAAALLSLSIKDKDFTGLIYNYQLSEGTLRFLWLTSILQCAPTTTFTLIDEPEVSLHPGQLMILAELLQEASDKTNLIAATHSSELISYLNPDEVVAMDTNIDGLAFATWADSLDLRAWLEDYHLGELWNMGRIGARHEAVG